MRYAKLPAIESTFKKTLKDAYGQVWKSVNGDFSAVMPDARYMMLENPHSSHFYKEKTIKKSITIHGTAGVLTGDIGTLGQKNKKMSTHFVIARDGTAYQLFGTEYWSYHLGSGASGGNTPMSKETVSIELSNLGPLTLKDDRLVDAYGKDYCLKSETDAYVAAQFRGKDFYATYTPAQIATTAILVDAICDLHKIEKKIPEKPLEYSPAKPKATIFGHQNVRKDKLDPGPAFSFEDLE